MRQQILSGDADYKMPSNKPLSKAFQEDLLHSGRQYYKQAHLCGPAQQKQMSICSLADRIELKPSCSLKDWGSQKIPRELYGFLIFNNAFKVEALFSYQQ